LPAFWPHVSVLGAVYSDNGTRCAYLAAIVAAFDYNPALGWERFDMRGEAREKDGAVGGGQ